MKRIYIIVAIILVLASLVVFGIFAVLQNTQDTNNSTNDNSIQEQQEFDQQVTIIDFEYLPKEITINAGDTVEWINHGAVGHNIIADDFTNTGGLPKDMDLFAKGQTFRHTFEKPGTYGYHDRAHPEMRGVIKVLP